MACGILPAAFPKLIDLQLRDERLPVMRQLAQAFKILGLEHSAIEALRESLTHKHTSQALAGFADLLGLWTGKLLLPSLSTNRVESPFPVQVFSMGTRPESRVVWRWMLQNRNLTHLDPGRRVLEVYDEWARFNPQDFDTFCSYTPDAFHAVDHKARFLASIFDETTEYFGNFDPGVYDYFVATHINVNAQSLKQADENIRTGHKQPRPETQQHEVTYKGDPIFMERAFIYVENLAKFISTIGTLDPPRTYSRDRIPSVEEAWWMLMLRMQVWNMIHDVVHREGITAPHHYYGDPSRVYIL